jgi:hypothetical protein
LSRNLRGREPDALDLDLTTPGASKGIFVRRVSLVRTSAAERPLANCGASHTSARSAGGARVAARVAARRGGAPALLGPAVV